VRAPERGTITIDQADLISGDAAVDTVEAADIDVEGRPFDCTAGWELVRADAGVVTTIDEVYLP